MYEQKIEMKKLNVSEKELCFLVIEDSEKNKVLEISYDGEIYLNNILIAKDNKLKQMISKCDLKDKNAVNN